MPLLRQSGSDFTSFVKAAAQYVPSGGAAAKPSKSGGVVVAKPGLGAVIRTSQVGAVASPTTCAVVINGVTAPAPVVASAPVAAFSPAGIAGLALWFDAADASTVTISSGNNISAWKDKSSNAISLGVFNGPGPPDQTYVQNAVNGLPVVDTGLFNVKYVTLMSMIPTTMFPNFVNTFFNVMNMTTTPAWNTLSQFIHLTNGGNWYRPSFNEATSNKVAYYNGSVGVDILIIPTGTPPNVQLTTSSNTGTTAGVSLNGSNASTATFGGLTTNPTEMYIWGRHCEIILYNRVLTADEQSKVQGYLAWKWGQQANLPAGHAYKAAAPTG